MKKYEKEEDQVYTSRQTLKYRFNLYQKRRKRRLKNKFYLFKDASFLYNIGKKDVENLKKIDFKESLANLSEEIMYKYTFYKKGRRKVLSYLDDKLLLYKKFINFFIFTGKGVRAFYNIDELLGVLKYFIKRSPFETVLIICNKLFPYYVKGYLKKGRRFFFVSKDPDCNQKYVVLFTWLFRALKGKRYSMYGINFEDVIDTLFDAYRGEGNAFNVQNKFYDVIDENAYLIRRYKKRKKKVDKEEFLKYYIKKKSANLMWENLMNTRRGFDNSICTWALKRQLFYYKRIEEKKRIGFKSDFYDTEFF